MTTPNIDHNNQPESEEMTTIPVKISRSDNHHKAKTLHYTKTPTSDTSMTPSTSRPRTPLEQAKDREDLEHKLEQNWNGLLVNDYMNADGHAAEELFEEEREQLSHPPRSQEEAVKPHAVLTPREEKEHQIEENWNGLLINDYMNCDGRAVEELLESERRQLSPGELEAVLEQQRRRMAERQQQQRQQKRPESPRDELEHKIENNWNGLLWLDYMNCDAGATQDLWREEREQLEAVSQAAQ